MRYLVPIQRLKMRASLSKVALEQSVGLMLTKTDVQRKCVVAQMSKWCVVDKAARKQGLVVMCEHVVVGYLGTEY